MTYEEIIKNTNKRILLSIGFGSMDREPTTWNKPVSKEKALSTIKWASKTTLSEYEDYILVHCYSACDMF